MDIKSCRFCWEGEDETQIPLLRHCQCFGTNAYVHTDCLKEWIEVRGESTCPLCKQTYLIEFVKTPKSFCDWLISEDDKLSKLIISIMILSIVIATWLVLPSVKVLTSLRLNDTTSVLNRNVILSLVKLFLLIALSLSIILYVRKIAKRWYQQNFIVNFI